MTFKELLHFILWILLMSWWVLPIYVLGFIYGKVIHSWKMGEYDGKND